MRKISVQGHLGGDPEIKTTKNGTAYTTFRIANTEYGEENPTWMTVTVWDSAQQNFCKNLKKGSGVIVDGDYSDRIYVSTKTNQPEIGRDIRSHAIYFAMSSNKKEDDGAQNAQNVQAAQVANEAPASVKDANKCKQSTNTLSIKI